MSFPVFDPACSWNNAEKKKKYHTLFGILWVCIVYHHYDIIYVEIIIIKCLFHSSYFFHAKMLNLGVILLEIFFQF